MLRRLSVPLLLLTASVGVHAAAAGEDGGLQPEGIAQAPAELLLLPLVPPRKKKKTRPPARASVPLLLPGDMVAPADLSLPALPASATAQPAAKPAAVPTAPAMPATPPVAATPAVSSSVATPVAPAVLANPGSAAAPAVAVLPPAALANPASAAAPAVAVIPPAALATPVSAAAPGVAVISPARRADGREDKHGFFAGLRLGLLLPSGRLSNVVSGPGQAVPFGKRVATLPITLQAGYRLPWLSRDLAIVAEGGWYPLSGQGSRAFPQDPDFSQLSYSWAATQIPLFLGAEYRLPVLLPGPFFSRFSAWGGASLAAVHSKFSSTYLAENVPDAPQSGWALGYALGAGAGFRLGLGQITFDFRYVSARTDLRLRSFYPSQPWNAEKGDVQGQQYLAGYRFAL